MKYIVIAVVIILIYRFYNIKNRIAPGSDQFPDRKAEQEPELEDFTDYEELDGQ